MMNPPRFVRLFLIALATIATATAPAFAQNEFGTTTAGESALIGILYDLKQTQQRVPTAMDPKTYQQVVNEFVGGNWDESVLNRYYRVTQPLYTTQLFIPLIRADGAPRAFGVEKIVEPRLWVAHYKGQVAAPTSGRWRFWGYSDDFSAVAVNGRTVLYASRFEGPWKRQGKKLPGIQAANGRLIAGDWIELKAGEVIDLDIIIGECPGGAFCSFVMIEREGDTYAMIGQAPVLPIFKLAPHATTARRSNLAPQFATDGPIWRALQ